MKPAWDQLSTAYEGHATVVIGDVDCTVEKDLCSKQGVRGYPTIKYWVGGEETKYAGGRDFAALDAFVKSTLAV